MKYDEIPMFHGAKPKIFENASILRKNMTNAESVLWNCLKNKQLNNVRFRRQHPISSFITDFYCHSAKLIIEVDGDIHNQSYNIERDAERTEELERLGLKVIRFTNHQVLNEIETVLEEIKRHI